jgi:phospholipid transport system substrate-binding protein
MKHLVRKFIACLCLSFFYSQAVFSADQGASAARQIVDKFEHQLIDVMKNGQKLGFKGRFDKLKPAVEESHDLPKIARIVVGKEWEKLSAAQQQQLEDTFSKLSVASYAHNFKDFSGEAFSFDSEEQTARGGVVVHSHLTIPDDKPVKFDYMLKESGTSWKIINIIANGVSDLALKRSEYTTILQREGFDALINKINDKIESYEKQ